VRQAIERFDREVAQLAPTLPDSPRCRGVPGAGPVDAPRLRAAFGEPRERYQSAAEVQQFAGLAPVIARRGHTCGVPWRQHGPQCRRQTVVAWAAQTIPHASWARAFDEQQRATGAAHQAALRALAFTWIRSVYRCWPDRTPDDDAPDLTALKRRGAPQLGAVPKSSNRP